MSSIVIYQIDAFASEPFTGNPAAVCLMTQPASDAWMAKMAKEMKPVRNRVRLARR